MAARIQHEYHGNGVQPRQGHVERDREERFFCGECHGDYELQHCFA
jgi:hypothetical protein